MITMTGIDVKMDLPLNLETVSIHVGAIHLVSSNVVMITKQGSTTVPVWKAVLMDAHVTTGIAMQLRPQQQPPRQQQPLQQQQRQPQQFQSTQQF